MILIVISFEKCRLDEHGNPRNYVGDLSLWQRIVYHHFLIFDEMLVQKCCCELCSK